MLTELGHVEALFRYPVKSMGGERLEAASLGWHGIDGDRRLALRRIDDRSGFPWLTAGKLPDLVRFAPLRRADGADEDLPTHIRTPDGEELPVFGPALAAEIARRYGAPVEMMQMRVVGQFEICSRVSFLDMRAESQAKRPAGTSSRA